MNPPFATDVREVSCSEELVKIQQVIRSDFSLRVHNFRIQAVDEGLILEGRTPTYYCKQLVQRAVMDLAELPILANNIIVG